MSQPGDPSDKIQEARSRIERAFRVKFDREPNASEGIVIALSVERVGAGEPFQWLGTSTNPVISHEPPSDLTEDMKWVLAKECACNLGFTLKESAEKYGLNHETLKKRSQREEWPLPSRIKELVPKVSLNAEITKLSAQTWAEKGEISRSLAWAITEKPLKELQDGSREVPKVAGWSDVATIVKLNRQAAGLDTDDSPANTNVILTLVNTQIEDGEAVETKAAQAREIEPE